MYEAYCVSTGPGQDDFPMFTDLSGGEVYCAPSQEGDSCPTPETHYICRDIRYVRTSQQSHIRYVKIHCVSSSGDQIQRQIYEI